MLEERLNPVLTQLRTEERERKANFEIVRTWFREHEEKLADDLADMTFVCELPHPERSLLTYPVIGNWYLDKMGSFKPQTDHQQGVYNLLRNLALEKRFNDHHMKALYDGHEEYNRMWDELNSVMLSNPTESLPLHEMMRGIHREVARAVYDGDLPQKDNYTIDLGHGLAEPSNSFEFLTWYFGTIMERGQAELLDLTIMVVDDQHPEAWYQRMVSVGFKHQEGQQGYFFDCESALEALGKGKYDVILTDLEVGEGKIGGIEFVERAFDIQQTRGIKPRISVFSYNDEKLQEAEDRLRDFFQMTPLIQKFFIKLTITTKQDLQQLVLEMKLVLH